MYDGLGEKRWSSMRVGDVRKRSANFSAILAPLSLHLTSITSVTITREDGVAMGTGDLTVSTTPVLDSTTLIVTCGLSAGQPGVDYKVTITVVASDGEVLVRDVFQMVAATLS